MSELSVANNERTASFVKGLENLINCYSQEGESDTPDFILAKFMQGCLESYNRAVVAREKWLGRGQSTTESAVDS